MEVSVHIPASEALKAHVACIYVMRHAAGEHRRYLSFPAIITNLSLIRFATVDATRERITLQGDQPDARAVVMRQNLLRSCAVSYTGQVVECTVFFTPLGVLQFPGLHAMLTRPDVFVLPDPQHVLFKTVFDAWSDDVSDASLVQLVEAWLLEQGQSTPKAWLQSALAQLDQEPMPSIHQLAASLGISRQTLHREFQSQLGISPAQYRRILRFRKAAGWSPNHGPATSLTGIAYAAEFADQSHMIRDFKALTGYVPRVYFRRIQRPFREYIQWMPA